MRSDQGTQVPAHVLSLLCASVSLGISLSPGVPDPTFCCSVQDATIPWEWHGATLAYATEAVGTVGWQSESHHLAPQQEGRQMGTGSE